MSKHDEEYFSYLSDRSLQGYLYRKYWLYPRIVKNINENEKVLDVGCGIGDFIRYRANTFGVDVNKEAVNYCKKEGLSASFMEIDVLPFESSSFDCIVLDNVLEHIVNPVPLLQEIKRVLNNGGKLIVGVPGIKGFAYDSDHKVFYNKDDLVLCLSDNGFNISKLFYTPFKFDWFNKNMRLYCVYGIFINSK